MTSAPSSTVLLIGFFAWVIFRRIRRNIGRQRLRPVAIIVRMVILSLAALMLLGAAFSFLGLRHTKFETTPEGHFYTPNTYIGVALSILLIGRMAYRMSALKDMDYTTGHPAAFQSPLTLFIIGVTIGYYLAYSIGLFVHTHDKR